MKNNVIGEALVEVVLILLFLPVSALIFLVFGTWRLIIWVILQWKYGAKFGGLMRDAEAACSIDDVSKFVVNMVMVVESKQNPHELVEVIRQKMRDVYAQDENLLAKLKFVRKEEFGYDFFLRDESDVDPIQPLHISDDIEILDEEHLQEIVSSYANKELPRNNKALWELLVVDKPIRWSKNCDNKEYALLLRIHHCFSDGVSMMRLLFEHFVDNPQAENPFVDYSINSLRHTYLSKLWERTRYWMGTAMILLFKSASVMAHALCTPDDENILHGQTLSGEKIVVWNREEDKRLVSIVKEIKNNIPKTAFSDIILAGVSASFHEYYQKKSKDVPDFVTMVIAVAFNVSQTFVLRSTSFSFGMLNLPVVVENSPLHRLEAVKKQTRLLRKSPEFVVNYWLFSFLSTFLPKYLLTLLLRFAGNMNTTSFSCLPGTDNKLSIYNGQLMKDVMFWQPHRGKLGINVSAYSYDKRFQFGVIADKNVISNKAEVQSIVDGIPKYIIELHEDFTKNKLNK